MVQIGERINLSTFGAVDDKSKVGNLYITFRVVDFLSTIWVATRITSVPFYIFGMEVFLLLGNSP
ncbi:hypothetical protein C1I91_16490 [Clostridium manihotivorum]|uniref:Uncharacterized protein n=1 Tax=Clostridium manihotivorum TaxID=2320868 RepID=A0A3R5TGS3_9CLOT|nr:hypothetical protein C1I91_16490 [Clostridium manihotivorum]